MFESDQHCFDYPQNETMSFLKKNKKKDKFQRRTKHPFSPAVSPVAISSVIPMWQKYLQNKMVYKKQKKYESTMPKKYKQQNGLKNDPCQSVINAENGRLVPSLLFLSSHPVPFCFVNVSLVLDGRQLWLRPRMHSSLQWTVHQNGANQQTTLATCD